jgi:3-deoxy-7-phosphoheptulonate synthase
VNDRVMIVMRVYFEKPRTTVGWKGLVMDPHLDGSHDIATGLRLGRTFLRDVLDLGLPTATELLDPITPQYIADLVCWSAIGARTTESQTHRQMASGLSMPLGFKNGTDGSIASATTPSRLPRSPRPSSVSTSTARPPPSSPAAIPTATSCSAAARPAPIIRRPTSRRPSSCSPRRA